MTKLKDGPGEENNPIVQYQEWAEHRYDPGHWLGGNTPPSTKGLYSGINRKWLGAAYVGAALVSTILGVRYAGNRDELLVNLLGLLLVYGIPGLIMLFARDRGRRRKRPHTPPAPHNSRRHTPR